ncbi:conserved hypothetical protein [Vibrio chagasii]|nr:conserved hypothetical protein [Vibrio chagasii]CAH7312117.1 conserved hypothetical protein [Vibrio chagasii]CAH7342718.1 conserved hypothetical protein [Vibrio chagasii]
MRKEKVLQLMKLFTEKLGGEVSDVKMMKLLYFTDRLSLVETGLPISYDEYFSLNRGPILSGAKNLIDSADDELYSQFFSATESAHSPNGYPVKIFGLKSDAPDLQYLSEQEIDFASKVFEELGEYNDDEIVLYSHRKDICPEWVFPDSSCIPISIETIFSTIGMTDEESKEQVQEINYYKSI